MHKKTESVKTDPASLSVRYVSRCEQSRYNVWRLCTLDIMRLIFHKVRLELYHDDGTSLLPSSKIIIPHLHQFVN